MASSRTTAWVAAVTCVMLFLVRPAPAAPTIPGASEGPAPDVLIINSYAPGYQWSDDMLGGVISALRRHYKDIEPVIQYLDARRFPDSEREAWLLADIQHKIELRPPHLIITLDNPAFDFALKYRSAIGPERPLVFGGLNRFVPEMIADHPGITGVSEESDFSGTFTLIEHLRPQARKVLVVSNPSPSAVETRKVFESFVPRFADRYSFEFFDTWTNDQLFARLATLGDEWVALILDATRDRVGADNYNNTAFYEAMRTRPRVPVFVSSRPPGVRDVRVEPWDTIGGGLIAANVHGQAVGEKALRVLAGDDAGSIPVERYSPQQLEVEYTQMKRFGLSLSLLPPGTQVNNAPIDFYRVNRSRIIQIAIVMVLLCGIIVALLLNIFWRRRAEQALRKAEEQVRASQKLEAIGLLAGGVAHDFNNILQVIRGHAGFLRESLGTTRPTDLEDLQEIESAAERATQLTRQLLVFSRKHTLNIDSVDPNTLVFDMVKMLRRLLGEHIELNVTPLVGSCLITADRTQLEQVILNLCLNARDAMPGGGRIHIELKQAELGPLDLDATGELKPGPHLVLVVSDTGSGMSPAIKRRIFEPFFTTKPTGKGTGLGLAVVYGVVRQHDGAISVYTEEGKGTAFRITLPIRPTDGESEQPPVAIEETPRGHGTILVAEDDAQVRSVAERLLRKNGFTVLTAPDGQVALDLVEKHHREIRLAVLDVIMPRVNGRQVYERLRELHPGIRVLFCSGYSAEMLSPEMNPGEGYALLNKPYTSNELLTQVHQQLSPRP